jgi:5'-nucleotidase
MDGRNQLKPMAEGTEADLCVSDLPLVIGVSTRALFDLEEEHEVFEKEGVLAYSELQRQRENTVLKPGAAFEVARRLLALNPKDAPKLVEIVVLSKNSPDLSLRAFNSFEHYGLSITRGSFTSGRPLAPFVTAWGVDLFLSNDTPDVRAAITGRTAAARLARAPTQLHDGPSNEVRFAFDGDAVIFSEESDEIYKKHGLERFLQHETKNARVPMNRGPFGNFLVKLSRIRELYMRSDGISRVRIAIVTARNAPSHERVVHTLRAWGTPADEAHFVGAHEKGPILGATGAHIFFDDQEKHVLSASGIVAAGLVPGPHAPDELIIPAGA